MCSLSDHVVEGILNYSLIPYAEQNNIEIMELIKLLSEYHMEQETKKKQPTKKTKLTIKLKGRPRGSKNKDKEQKLSVKSDDPVVPKTRGRPKGSSTNKHSRINVGL
tara:strand:- start:1538 stop:1858 length:321 start_codon:yes stop_codon:yes gene_type:complete